MDYIFRGQGKPFCYDSFPGFYRREVVTDILKPFLSRCAENSAAYAASHLERGVGGVYDGVDLHFCYVITDYV